jgi:uncharacterized protein DUF2442
MSEVMPSAPWRVRSLEVIPNARLRVSFVDGTRGEVDMASMLASPQTDGTVFEPLRDPHVFSQARIVLGAVTWPNGADLAPDAMHDEIRARGVWIVE